MQKQGLLTVSGFAKALELRGYQDRTRQSYSRSLSDFFQFIEKHFPLWQPFQNMVQNRLVERSFTEHLLATKYLSRASTNAAVTAVTRFFSINGHRTNFGVQKMCPPADALSALCHHDMQAIQVALRSCGRKHAALLSTVLGAGLRPRELASLTIKDLVTTGIVGIHVRADVDRFVPMEPEYFNHLKLWVDDIVAKGRAESGSTLVFANKDGNAISQAGFDYLIKYAGQRCQILLSARILRNTYILTRLQQGVGPVAVAELAGYSNTNFVLKYLSTAQNCCHTDQ